MSNKYIVQEKINCADCKSSGRKMWHNEKGFFAATLCSTCAGLGYTLKPSDLETAIKRILYDENNSLSYTLYSTNKEIAERRGE